MDGPRRSAPPPADPAGAGRPWRPSMGLLVVALLIVAAAVAYEWLSPSSSPAPLAEGAAPPAAPPSAASGTAVVAIVRTAAAARGAAPSASARPGGAASAAAPHHIQRMRDPNGDQTPDLADYVNEGERPTMAQVIDRLHQAGVYTGLGAFQPPGTRPPLVGLAVPEGFVLPPGYVRHYQATDDGQRIEPILMFSPDYQFVDAAGRPVPIPKDRVVPPELAPPGMPIRRITIPAPVDPEGSGS